MWDFIVCSAVILVGGLIVAALTYRWRADLRLLAWGGFAAHTVSSFVLYWVVHDVYGVGDLLSYLRQGHQVADYLRFTGHVDDVVSLICGGTPTLPFLVLGAGSSTGSTSGIAGLFYYILASDRGVNLTVSLLAFSGQIATYAALRDLTAREWHARLLAAAVLLPSAVFWTSGILKETLAVWGLGWVLYALGALLRRRFAITVLLGAPGALLVGLIKPYILFPVVTAAGVFVYWQSGIASQGDLFRVKPTRLIGGALIAVLGVVALGRVFPQYSLEHIGDEIAFAQSMGELAGGGSFIEAGPSEERGLAAQIAYVPFALVSALVRPLPIDVDNAAMAVNALESTALLFLMLRLGFARRWVVAWARLRRSPALMFCAVMTLLLGVGIGLTTTNMGTLSRYRVPMMPFYVGLLLILLLPAPRAAATAAPALRRVPRVSRASQRSTTRSSS